MDSNNVLVSVAQDPCCKLDGSQQLWNRVRKPRWASEVAEAGVLESIVIPVHHCPPWCMYTAASARNLGVGIAKYALIVRQLRRS